MKNLFLLISIIFVSVSLFADGLMKPESIFYYSEEEQWLVSDVGNMNTDDGRIVAIDTSATITEVIATGLKDPKGFCISNASLIIADLTNIVVVDYATGTILKSIPVQGAKWLNDVCLAGDYVYISDNQTGKIYRYNPTDDSIIEFCDVAAANGIYYEEASNSLLVVRFDVSGEVMEVNLETAEVSLKKLTEFGYQDGITTDRDGNFYISNWEHGQVNIFDEDFNYIETLINELNGPADLYFDKTTNFLGIPVMEQGEVIFIEYFDPPSKPMNLVPSTGSTNLPTTFLFYWSMCDRALAYSAYFSKDAAFPNDQTLYGTTGDQVDTTYTNEEPLDEASLYYWYVESVGMGGVTSSDTMMFTTKGYSAVDDSENSSLSIYPMPIKNELHIDISDLRSKATIKVFDINGRCILEDSISKSQNIINTSDFPKGSYIVEILVNGSIERRKIIK